MYVPPAFKEEEPAKLFNFIRQYSFGVLFSGQEENLLASHLPFLTNETIGQKGILLSHMAKANNHWQVLEGREVLVVFQGPQAYLSPSWYEEVEVVPTWNYAAVHVYGKFLTTNEGETRETLERMVGFYEATLAKPWKLESLPKDFFEKLLKMIVGFKIEINRLEGKWKLSQNHSAERRQKVIQALEKGANGAKEVAKLMKERETQ